MENNIQPDNFFLLISIGILAMLLFAIGLIVVFFTAQRKLLNEKMQQQVRQLQHKEELLFATIKTQEKERERIARDLHEEIGSKLNVTLLNLGFLKRKKADLAQIKTTIEEVEGLLRTTVDTTRRISHDLLPPVLQNFGLVAAIEELKDAYQNTELVFNFDATKATERLDDQLIELNLFRVVQELLKNSIVHGEAKQIQLQISTQPPAFKFHYQDDGKGFDVASLQERKGLGTQNIESRLDMCGAAITYESSIGQGVKAIIEVV